LKAAQAAFFPCLRPNLERKAPALKKAGRRCFIVSATPKCQALRSASLLISPEIMLMVKQYHAPYIISSVNANISKI
jgi:hypothetical protein